MKDVKSEQTRLDATQLKKLRQEINKELSRAVANSQLSRILKNYGISDPNYLKIRCSLSPDKSRVSEFAKTSGYEITSVTNAEGSSFYECPVPDPDTGDTGDCQDPDNTCEIKSICQLLLKGSN